MTFEEFDKFQAELLKEVVAMKDTKGKEYANSDDRFANFNRDAKELVCDRLLVALILMNKHVNAVKSYVMSGGKYWSNENIRMRIVDIITYYTLIAGMVSETEATQLATAGVNPAVVLEDKNSGKHQPMEYDPTPPTFDPIDGKRIEHRDDIIF